MLFVLVQNAMILKGTLLNNQIGLPYSVMKFRMLFVLVQHAMILKGTLLNNQIGLPYNFTM